MKFSEIPDKRLIAACGLNCEVCSAHVREKNVCPGCKYFTGEESRKSCKNCAIRNCAAERGHDWCFECKDFPCEKMTSLIKRYKLKYDVDLIQNGHDAADDFYKFLLEQRKLNTCPKCSGVVDQHKKICSECGADYKK